MGGFVAFTYGQRAALGRAFGGVVDAMADVGIGLRSSLVVSAGGQSLATSDASGGGAKAGGAIGSGGATCVVLHVLVLVGGRPMLHLLVDIEMLLVGRLVVS
jgi:hypothetical protein